MAKDEFFPDSPRVFYDKAPLKQVVCQFRFPPILRIDAEIPSIFQEHIREALPLAERVDSLMPQFQIPKQILDALGGQIGAGSFKFFTEDRKTCVELSSSTLTCVADEYSRWEHFVKLCDMANEALINTYKPAFYTRIGLRYSDVIDRKKIGLEGVLWHELLSKPIIGELGEHFIENNVEAIQKSIRVRNSDNKGGFLLQHGLVEGSSKAAYYVDFDFYVDQKTELKDAKSTLDSLHDRSGLAWRWCITPKLHDSLGPHDI